MSKLTKRTALSSKPLCRRGATAGIAAHTLGPAVWTTPGFLSQMQPSLVTAEPGIELAADRAKLWCDSVDFQMALSVMEDSLAVSVSALPR